MIYKYILGIAVAVKAMWNIEADLKPTWCSCLLHFECITLCF